MICTYLWNKHFLITWPLFDTVSLQSSGFLWTQAHSSKDTQPSLASSCCWKEIFASVYCGEQSHFLTMFGQRKRLHQTRKHSSLCSSGKHFKHLFCLPALFLLFGKERCICFYVTLFENKRLSQLRLVSTVLFDKVGFCSWAETG